MPGTHRLLDQERALLHQLRRRRHEPRPAAAPRLSSGQRIADGVAAVMGSWPFIIVQTLILLVWMALNVAAFVRHWDPYPFILPDLARSFPAARAAPFIMTSRERRAASDRADARHDHEASVRSGLGIEPIALLEALRPHPAAGGAAAERPVSGAARTSP